MSTLARIREHLDQTQTSTHEAREAALQLIESAFSHDEVRTRLRGALNENRTAPDGSYIWRYIHAIYNEFFIYEEDINVEKLYKRTYSIADDGTVTLGTPVEVRVEYVPVSQETTVIESMRPLQGDCVRLSEAIAAKSGSTMRVKRIAAGWNVTDSTYYSEAMLRQSGASAFPVGTQMFWNHPTVTESIEQPERNLDYLAAVIVSTPEYSSDDADGPGLYAECKVFSDYAPKVKEIADYIGLSIYAFAAGADGEAEGKVGRIIEKLIPSPFNTVDFVTVPGAGGAIVQIFESAGRTAKVVAAEAIASGEAQTSTSSPEATPSDNPTPQGESLVTTEERLAEALTRIETLETQNARQSEAIVLNQAEAFTATVLAGYDADALPPITRNRLQESLSKRPVLATDGTIDREATRTMIAEAVTTEVKYLQESTGWGTGATRTLGQPTPEEELLTNEQVQESLTEALSNMGLSADTARIASNR